jgi:hypothetical protein
MHVLVVAMSRADVRNVHVLTTVCVVNLVEHHSMPGCCLEG